MHRRTLVALAALATGLPAATVSLAQTGEIRIAHVYSKTGPFEAYGKQTQTGLLMGLNYATGGSMTINGKKLVVIEKDDQGKPDLGKSLLAAAYSDDKADIAVGPTSSGVALALLPVAEEYKKILLVEPAVADAITGDKWNKYIFRTGRNSSQDAISNAVAIDKAGVTVATLAQDRLVLHIDRFDTNEPVVGAQVEVDTGTVQAKATPSAPGVYWMAQGTLGQPGKHPLTITIETEDTADLLSATLEVPTPAAATAAAATSLRTEPWMAWGLGGALLLSGAGLVALRRRPRAITPGSTV